MTATGKDAQIFDALMTRVGTMVLRSPAIPVAYPDIAFDPATEATDGKYVEVSYFPNRPAWEGVAAGALRQGLLQLTVVWPRGAGLVAPLQIAELIKTHFAKSTAIVSGTTKVKVSREPWAASPLIDARETRIPVTIPWTA